MILLILWLGTGNLSKGMLLFLTAFPIIAAASAAGVRGVKRQRVQAARALGASGAAVFRHVILPSAAPMIMTGLQIALAAAFTTVVSAEYLAATDGLGWMVLSGCTWRPQRHHRPVHPAARRAGRAAGLGCCARWTGA